MTGKVVLGFAHNGGVTTPFMQSVADFLIFDGKNRKLVSDGGGIATAQSPYIPDSRNLVVGQFLKTDAEYLWFLDTDVVFSPGTLYHMLESMDDDHRIMGGMYFTYIAFPFKDGDNKYVRGMAKPVLTPCFLDDDGYPITSFSLGQVIECGIVGMGCTVIHRSVLEDMGKKYEDPWRWFGHDNIPGRVQPTGEDVTFCRRARDCGFKSWGHTGVVLEHLKVHRLTIIDYMTANGVKMTKNGESVQIPKAPDLSYEDLCSVEKYHV